MSHPLFTPRQPVLSLKTSNNIEFDLAITSWVLPLTSPYQICDGAGGIMGTKSSPTNGHTNLTRLERLALSALPLILSGPYKAEKVNVYGPLCNHLYPEQGHSNHHPPAKLDHLQFELNQTPNFSEYRTDYPNQKKSYAT